MKRALVLAGLLLSLSAKAHALTGTIGAHPENSDYFVLNFTSAPNQAKTTLTGGSTQFAGFGTNLELRVAGSTDTFVTFSTSYSQNLNSNDTSSSTLAGGQYSFDEFYVPVASPTILFYQITGGATFSFRLGGVKNDR